MRSIWLRDGGPLERVGDETAVAERERGGRDAADLADERSVRGRPPVTAGMRYGMAGYMVLLRFRALVWWRSGLLSVLGRA
jgi:hypothetical protein